MLKEIADKIIKIAEESGSEAKLQIQLEGILKDILEKQGIKYNPFVNESLRKLGLSQVSADRPDSLFGHVVMDYKAPGFLTASSNLSHAKKQIVKYLNSVTHGGPAKNPRECTKWAGILWDGFKIAFCYGTETEWRWTALHDITESTLLSLIQIYRSLRRMPLTARLLTKHFGKNSGTAQRVLPIMCSHLSKRKHRTTMLYHEWRRLFEQVSTYRLSQLPSLKEWAKRNGIATKDASLILFAMHTYYSIVVKLLTAELLATTQTTAQVSLVDLIANAPDTESIYSVLRKIENGIFYQNYRISNFLEGDFFSWYTNEESDHLANSLRMLARKFQDFEPATAKLKPEIIKDLLKEFYTSLVDEQIRHDLGEYYTPDWLAEYVLERVGYNGQIDKIVVDPACGSGTFLVECITKLKVQCKKEGLSPLQTLQMILKCVRGLDLNPLAVISARANYILAIADLIFSLGHDVEIPVYLADSINVPVERDDGILEYILDTEVEDIKLEIPVTLVQAQILGKILLKCEEDIERSRDAATFINGIQRDQEINEYLDKKAIECLTKFFTSIQKLHQRKPPWDTIWCRIVKNNFSPKSFRDIDFIIGNPPWVRWSRLPETYRCRVKRFCDYYGLVSGKGYTGGIESDISTVLAYSAADQWLKIDGKIGILITSTVFKSDSARGFRLSKLPDSTGIRINNIEELNRIKPFPDAVNETSIYIATKIKHADDAAFTEIPCRIWYPVKSSRIDPSLSLKDVFDRVTYYDGVACPVAEFGSPLWFGKKTEYDEVALIRGKSPYLQNAHRGTVTDLARVFWVMVEKYSEETNRALIRTLREDELPRARIIEPVEGAWIEADVLFPLIRGRDLGRYCSKTEGWYQIIPNRHYSNFETEDEFAEKYPAAYSYLMNYEELLGNRSTYKRYQKDFPIYSIYCVGDYSFQPYKVIWLEQQNPNKFRAAVISYDDNSVVPNKVIVPDHKIYFASVSSLEEAHYICAFLNSHPVRTWLGGFLIGKQIGTTIFEYMNLPPFNPDNTLHRTLVELSEEEHSERTGTKNTGYLSGKKEQELTRIIQKVTNF